MKFLIRILLLFIFSCSTINGQQNQLDYPNDSLKSESIEQLYRQKEYIYARHGYSFESDSSKAHFMQYDWYQPNQRNRFIRLTDLEELQVGKINNRIEELLSYRLFLPEGVSCLAKDEILAKYSSRVKSNIGLSDYQISYVFSYEDAGGSYQVVLGESAYNNFSKMQDRAIFNDAIKGVLCKEEGGYLLKRVEMEDKIWMKGNLFDLRFLPQYTHIDDIDADGFVDPVFVYSTYGMKGYDEGQVSICLIYKSKIFAINLQHDGSKKNAFISGSSDVRFFPEAIKKHLILLIEKLQEDKICILDDDWSRFFKR